MLCEALPAALADMSLCPGRFVCKLHSLSGEAARQEGQHLMTYGIWLSLVSREPCNEMGSPASREEGLPWPLFALVRRTETQSSRAERGAKRCRLLQVSSRHFNMASCFTSGLMPTLDVAEVPVAQPSDQAKWQSTCGGQFLQQRPSQLRQENATFVHHKSGPTQAGSSASTSESRTCLHRTRYNNIWHFGVE